ncbi:MAG: hypothetical protein GY822_30005 [Deltaproteobacteria bacterium]|nr:hypothetical protein [Deltaproteobacteria bacterium]
MSQKPSAISPWWLTLFLGLLFFASISSFSQEQKPQNSENRTDKQIVRAAMSDDIPLDFLPKNGLLALDFGPLLPEDLWTATRPALAAKTAQEHAFALQEDPLHGERFWVESVLGAPENERVVFVIPQFHRSSTQPLDWSSLGAEIRDVQRNIDVILTRLARAHGVRCVGTEGSALDDIQTPNELKQIARWRFQQQTAQKEALVALGEDGKNVREAMASLERLADDAMQKRVQVLDGAGLALLRLRHDDMRIKRFGLEDLELNASGVRWLKKINKLDEKLALLEPTTQSTSAGVIGLMWLEEFPTFERDVILPFQSALLQINTERKALLGFGDDGSARLVGRYASIVRHIMKVTLDLDGVIAYHDYYQEVEARGAALSNDDDGGESEMNDDKSEKGDVFVLSSKQKRQKRRLEKRRKKMDEKYQRITYDKREAMAVKRVLERLSSSKKETKNATPSKLPNACAVVFGAHHQNELAKRFVEKGISVVVVAPFHFE